MKINDSVLDILRASRIENNILYLPDQQLDRKTYEQVNKVIEMLGGKWNRKQKGHVFDVDPAEKLASVLNSEEATDWKKDYQFFPTPKNLAEHMCDLAEIDSNSFVLEPSCGRGDLADVIWARNPAMLYGVEINKDMDVYLKDKPYDTAVDVDFLSANIAGYWDRIVMNPPFHNFQDVDHIMEAYRVLADDGILVSVVSESTFQRNTKKASEFRNWLNEHNAYIETIDAGAFKSSGTMVATRVIKIYK